MSSKLITDILQHLWGKAPFPQQLSFILDTPLRRFCLTPGQLADRLPLAPDACVLEVGAGPGYFSDEVARWVPRGRLVLLDVQREMLEKAQPKLKAAGVDVVDTVQASAERLPFRGGLFHVLFLVQVLGKVPDRRAGLRDFYRVLQPGGCLSITEHLPDPDFSRLATVQRLGEEEGFTFVASFGQPWNYTANFRVR
jgi:ubiquinone/menaquinone biosynthesis C-methylase UbiE